MNKTKICNYLCIAMMAILLILQFTPFWSFDGGNASIQSYIWFPDDYKPLTEMMQTEFGKDYNIGELVFPMVAILLTTAAGIVLSIIKSDNPAVKIIPIAGTLIGIYGFLSKPDLRLGSTWVIQLILCIAVIATAALTIFYNLKEESKES